MFPKSVGAPPGPSLGHIDGQHGLDGWEFVAGEVGDQLLGTTPRGKNLKSDPGLLLGTQGWHTDGEGYGLSVDVKAPSLALAVSGEATTSSPLSLSASLLTWVPSVL